MDSAENWSQKYLRSNLAPVQGPLSLGNALSSWSEKELLKKQKMKNLTVVEILGKVVRNV